MGSSGGAQPRRREPGQERFLAEPGTDGESGADGRLDQVSGVHVGGEVGFAGPGERIVAALVPAVAAQCPGGSVRRE